MENTKVKMTDEKYCSECGEIIKKKAEICTNCGIRQLPISEDKKLGEKFLFSGGVTLVAFLIIIFITTPQNTWMNGVIGSFVFALVSALLGMAIPTTKKIIYIPVSLAIMLFVTMMIGFSLK